MVAVQMLIIGGAGHQGLFGFTQRLLPDVRLRASMGIAMAILETGGKERFQCWMQEVKRWRRWHGAIRSGMVSTIGKMT